MQFDHIPGTLTDTHIEHLFDAQDAGWKKPLPTRLLHYSNGTMDLHLQTGPSFDARVAQAAALLRERNLTVGPVEFIGSSGAYLPVRPIY